MLRNQYTAIAAIAGQTAGPACANGSDALAHADVVGAQRLLTAVLRSLFLLI